MGKMLGEGDFKILPDQEYKQKEDAEKETREKENNELKNVNSELGKKLEVSQKENTELREKIEKLEKLAKGLTSDHFKLERENENLRDKDQKIKDSEKSAEKPEMVNNYTKEDWNEIQESLKEQADKRMESITKKSEDEKQGEAMEEWIKNNEKAEPEKSGTKQAKTEKQVQSDAAKIAEDFEQDFGKKPEASTETSKPSTESDAATIAADLESDFGKKSETPLEAPKPSTENDSQQIHDDIMEDLGVKRVEGIENDPDYGDLTAKREAFIRAKMMLENSDKYKGKIPPDQLELNFQKAREAYKEAAFVYAKSAIAKKKEFLKANGYEGADFECELSSFKEALFKTLVIDGIDLSAQYERQNFEPTEKSIWRRMGDGFKNMKGWKKVLIGGTIGAGLVVSGAIAGGAPIGAAIMYGGWRLLKGAAAYLGGKGIFKMGNSLANKSFEKHRAKGIENRAKLFSGDVEKNMANRQEFWKFLQNYNEGYQRVLADASKKRKYWKIGTAGAAVLVGAGIYGGLSQFDHTVHDMLYSRSETPNYEPGPNSDSNPNNPGRVTENPGPENTPPATPENTPPTGPENPNPGPENTPPATPENTPPTGPENTPPENTPPTGPENAPNLPSPEAVQNWASANYGNIDLRGMTVGDVIDPRFVENPAGVSPEYGNFQEMGNLNDRIAFRNKVMEFMQLRESAVSSVPMGARNVPIIDLLQQKL